MKKTLLILAILIAGQFPDICRGQEFTNNQGICVYSADYADYFFLNIHFYKTKLNYQFEGGKFNADFLFDTVSKKITLRQFPLNSDKAGIMGQYVLKDEKRIDTVAFTRPFPPYDIFDTIVHRWTALKDGIWEYCDESGTIIRQESYKKGKLTKAFVKNEKGEMIELKKQK